MIRRVALALAAVAAATLAAPTASAAPSGEPFELSCGELGELTAVINSGQGIWTPAFVVGSTQRLIPYAFDVTVDGTELAFEFVKNPPRNGRTDACTFDGGFGGVSGTVWVSYAPAH
jgi:hypothetical protein